MVLCAASAAGAHAGKIPWPRSGTFGTSPIKVNAFGTLGAVYQDSPDLAFRRMVGQGHGARAGQIDLGTDSLLGLQISGSTSFGLSAQLQGIVRRNAAGAWRPGLTRAFVRYEPNQVLMVRAGRIGLSVYLLGDALDVGYSYLPIRPPQEVYGQLASDLFNGADLTVTKPIGAGVAKVRLLGGQLPFEIGNADGSVSKENDNRLLGITAEFLDGGWESRIALVQIHLHSSAAAPLAQALDQTRFPGAVELAGALTKTPQNTLAMEIGANYTGERLLATAVYARLDSDYLVGPHANTGYLLLGWRISNVTPYALFSVSDSFASVRSAGLPPIPLFAPLTYAAGEAQTALQTTQRHLALGLRYDFARHMDVKAQIDRIWLHQSMLVFDYHAPPFGHATMTVAGVALDFAF